MSFDNIIAAGCSFTWGDELIDRESRYISLLSKHYNAKLYDFSRNGNSNETISSNIIHNTSKLLADHVVTPENTLVIVQWSHKDRLHYYSKSGNYHRLAPHNMLADKIKISNRNGVHRHVEDSHVDAIDLKMYYENHNTMPFLTYNTIIKIHHVQMFLQNKNMKYIFLFASKYDREVLFLLKEDLDILRTKGRLEKDIPPSLQRLMLPDVSGLFEDIDKSKVYEHPFLEYCKINKYEPALGGHPKEDAHLSYSQELIKFIGDLYD